MCACSRSSPACLKKRLAACGKASASKCAAIASYFMAAANSIPICALSAFCILAEIIMVVAYE